MKSGIKGRLIWSYLLLIILTVLLFESTILSALRFYYLGGVKQTLRDQGTMFTSVYEEELAEGNLEEKAQLLLQRYNFIIKAQVQIIDNEGNILADTHSSENKNVYADEDVSNALSGATGYSKGSRNGESILSVAQPIRVQDEIRGAIRFTTSMEQLNAIFKQNTFVLMTIGVAVILVATIISYFVASTITHPVSRITAAAQQMASGKFSTRISKGKNDELGKLADTLNYMAEEVERHERLKNEFIASVSHELRTPLTSVKGWAITLQSMADDKFIKDGLDIISTESDRLSMLLGDLLDLSSLSAGKVQYKFENIFLKDLLHQVVHQLEPRAERQGIGLREIYDTNITMVKGDKNRLKQVFINVIDNALKFTSEGGSISISLTVKNSEVLIRITDTGEGIPAEELEMVKKKFHKGKSKGSGTGLGLAICQEIIQAHKGTFDISSMIGTGTTVEVKLPM